MDEEFKEDEFEGHDHHPYHGGYDIGLTYGTPLPHSDDICYPISSFESVSPFLPPDETPPPVIVSEERPDPGDFGVPREDYPRPEPYEPRPVIVPEERPDTGDFGVPREPRPVIVPEERPDTGDFGVPREPRPVIVPEERPDPGDFGVPREDYPRPEPYETRPVIVPEDRPNPGDFGVPTEDYPRPEPYESRPGDYSEPGYDLAQPEPFKPHPFGYWPFETVEEEKRLYGHDGRRGDSEETGDWILWKRAADHVFGYSHGYGERIIGTDWYGVPIYANKKHGYEQSLSLEVKPARDYQLEQRPLSLQAPPSRERDYRLEQWSSSRDERRDESYVYGSAIPVYFYERHHHYEQPLHVQVEPIESSWTAQKLISYHEAYEEQGYTETSLRPSFYNERKDENNLYGSTNFAYDKQWSSSRDERRDESYVYGSAIPEYFYERHHHHEQPLHVQVEPIESSWTTQKLISYHEAYEEQGYTETSLPPFYDERKDESNLYGSANFAYDKHAYEQPLHVQLEPFESTWSRKATYHDAYEEHSSSESNWLSAVYDDGVKDRHFDDNPNHDYGKYNHEQPRNDELEPYESNWSRYASYYGSSND